jgi:hypothetical protein
MSDKQETRRTVSFFARLSSKFKHGLVLHSVVNQLNRIGIRISPYYWVQEGINAEEPAITGEISEYNVGFIDSEELLKTEDNLRSYSPESLLSYFKAGNKCLGLKHKDELASFMFINLKECDFASNKVPMKDDEAYLTFMYTFEAYRGKNLAPYLRYKSYGILREMGRNKIYSISAYFNSAAIRYKEKLNAKNLKLILYIELFKRIKWRVRLRTY